MEGRVLQAADLMVAITADSPDPVGVGQTLSYTVEVSNQGPDAATGVVLNDTLAASVTFVDASSDVGDPPTQANGVVTAGIGGLAANQTATVTIRVRPNAAGTISNAASVAGTSTDPDMSNNTAKPEETQVLDTAGTADVALTMTAAPGTVGVGENLTYTITVRNNGPASVPNVTVLDTLPDGLTFVSATSGTETFTPDRSTITANLGTLAKDASATLTIVVKPTGRKPARSVSNTATLGQAEVTDLNQDNNSASVTSAVQSSTNANLSVAITDTPDPVAVNQNVTYVVTVTNAGPDAATNVVLTDTLPAGVTVVSSTSSQGGTPTADRSTITANLGSLASGATATLTLVVKPTAAGTLTNSARVISDVTDPDSANNVASQETTVQSGTTTPGANLSVAIADSPDPVAVNQNVTYVVTVTNAGPDAAANVVLTDILPAGATLVSSTASQGAPPTNNGGTLTANLGSLASGATATLTLVVKPTAAGTLRNSASVANDVTDPDSANNVASQETTVQSGTTTPGANLSVAIADSPDPVAVNQNVTYVVTVTNAGPDAAANVVLTDILPAGATLVSSTASQGGTPTNNGGTLTANLGGLASGATATLTLVVKPTAAGTLSNSASVTSDVSDPDSANNAVSESTTVASAPATASDLAVSVTGSPGPVIVGRCTDTYTVTVTNIGPDAATNVVLTGGLPGILTFVSATASQGDTPTATAGTLVANLGGLASGASATVTVTAVTNAAGAASTTFSVAGAQVDPASGNNAATVNTSVQPAQATAADLSVSLVGPGSATVGDGVLYVYTVRNTGAAAENVVLTSNLPPGLAFIFSNSTSGIAVVQAGGVVTAPLGTLADGQTATVYVVVKAVAAGLLTGDVSVNSATTEEVRADNVASSSIAVAEAVTAPPHVVSLVRYGFHTMPTQLVLTFDKALDAVSASDRTAYTLIDPGRDRRFGTRDDRTVRIVAARYDDALHQVTLSPAKRLYAFQQFQLVVNAAKVRDASGNNLDGNGDGLPGGNYRSTFDGSIIVPNPVQSSAARRATKR